MKETSGGLVDMEAGPTQIEVQLHDADEQVVAKSAVQVNAIITKAEPVVSGNAPGLHGRDFVPAEGETMLHGTFVLKDPKPESVVQAGTEVPLGFVLQDAMNAHMADVVVTFNGVQVIYQFQGAEGAVNLPGFPPGRHSLNFKLLGPEPAPWKDMVLDTVFTVGEKQQVEEEQMAALLGQTIEPDSVPSQEELVLTIGGDEPLGYYQTFLGSLRHAGSSATVAVFVPTDKISDELRSLASESGALLVPYNPSAPPLVGCHGKEGAGTGCIRLYAFRHWLMEHLMEWSASRILIADLDTLFQADPFSSIPAGEGLTLFSVSDNLVLEDDDSFSHYLFDQCLLYRGEMLNQVGDKPALWSGTLLGSFDTIVGYLDAMANQVTATTTMRVQAWSSVPQKQTANACHEKGVHNVLAYTGGLDQLGTDILSSETGPVFVTYKWPAIRLSADNKVLLPESESPAAMVVGAHDFPDLVAVLSGGTASGSPDASGARVCPRKE
eukprot:CAMPEP_0114540060 /NCGR_PEP_ID=MMETSP0114-20121206/565_1 /TAXON_ID=31324 /ORGANISM="Goniomonas sp, Strain m" /LENGTH=494 /DNA_ID=CAMNT_0001724195 /DNA_START=210 /DNA_END=1694 /DNA_ORIENTATION=+